MSSQEQLDEYPFEKMDKPKIETPTNRAEQNMQNLFESAQRERMEVFSYKGWTVLAPSPEALQANLDEVNRIDSYQDMFEPQKLWGQCIYVHEGAELYGVSDSSLSARRRRREPYTPIYPIRGIHCIGVKDNDEHSIYFDITARPYVFTPEYDANEAISKGLIVVDGLGRQAVIEDLYQCDWTRSQIDRDDRNQEYIQYTLDEIKKTAD